MSRPRPDKLPEHLREIWDEMSAQVVGNMSAVNLEALCVQVHRMRDAEARISAEGLVVSDSKGNPVPHPAIAIEKAAQSEVRSWMSKYARLSTGDLPHW